MSRRMGHFMTLLLSDEEEDILAAHLRDQLERRFDYMIVTDNLSSD